MIINNFLAKIANPTSDDVGLPEVAADQSSVQEIIAIVLGVAVAISILIIVIAGFNITTGGGDPDKIARGKKTIIFALVGLAISVSAEVIVLTVLNRL
jgi:hypothetical protein